MAGDKGYSAKDTREWLRVRQIEPVIPTRKNEERDPKFLIANHYLEKCEDQSHNGKKILASRLGYRFNVRFVHAFFGRVFNHPHSVFTDEMLRPELQDRDVFADGMDNIVATQQRVAQMYFADGSVKQACPPLVALLHIMLHDEWESKGLDHPDVRKLFTRDNLLASDWYAARLAGTFVQESRQVRTFRLDNKGRTKSIRYILTVDGVPGRDPLEVSRSLSKGVHRLELYVAAQRDAAPEFELLADTPQPPYLATCPATLFVPALKPAPAAITTNSTGAFEVTFAPETRARLVRFWLLDFETDAPAITKVLLADATGKTVLPPATDVVALRKNQTLEIVPGDRVTVTYNDPHVVTKQKQVLEGFLTATFHNATLSACFIESDVDNSGNRRASYIPMRRFKPGDTINVFINDADGDVTDQPDKLKFWTQVAGGARVELEALETEAHSGVFLGKVFPIAGAPQRPAEVTVGKNDDVTIGYFDQENTDPGIPWERTTIVEQTAEVTPRLTAYDIVSRP